MRFSWRWAPVAALVALLVALPSVVAALPVDAARPADLLARVRASADVGWSGLGESTGLLALPDVRELGELPALFGGTTRARTWWRGPTAHRVDVLTALGETGLVVDAAGSWTWDSERRRAVRLDGAPAVRLPRAADLVAPLLGRRLAGTPGLRPQPLGDRRVAGFATAGLRLVPGTGAPTTVSAVDLWVEPRSGLPLRVEVRARGVDRPVLQSELLDLDLSAPDLVRVAFSPPPDADVRLAEVADLAAAADRYARTVLPEALAGQARTRGAVALGGVATYGSGLGTFAVVPLSRDLGRAVLRRLDEDDTDGRADVRTPLLNAAVVRVRGGVLVVAGTVPPAVLDSAVAGLQADPLLRRRPR